MSTDTRKPIKERIAEHYNPVPARATANPAPDTDEHAAYAPHPTASQVPSSQRRMPPPRPVEEDDDEEVYETRPPSSTRRYKPPTGSRKPASRSRRRGPSPLVARILVVLSIAFGIVMTLVVPPLWRQGMDWWTYHFPRTYQVDANVGHGTANAPNSHFIAINNHGLIEVLEIPTGIPSQDNVRLYLIAQIDGPSPDQASVTLEFQDVNGDGKPNLIVHCNGNEYILSNDGHTFKKS